MKLAILAAALMVLSSTASAQKTDEASPVEIASFEVTVSAEMQTSPPTHSVTLAWADPNPAGAAYTIYRSVGLCSGTPTFSKMATALAVKTYQDTAVSPGNYCYTVTATMNNVESPQSAPGAAQVPAFAPTGLTIVVQ